MGHNHIKIHTIYLHNKIKLMLKITIIVLFSKQNIIKWKLTEVNTKYLTERNP